MEKYFLEVLHEGDIINETSLEMLKGGFGVSGKGCKSLTSCVCYKGDICKRNKKMPDPTNTPTDSTTVKH